MCGIYGAISNSSILDDLKMGLYAIQHRGQDACGLLTVEDGEMKSVKVLGLVEELIKRAEVDAMQAPTVGIGQVRYPTVGLSTLDEAQPFVNREAGIGLVHNGNIINLDEQKERLRQRYGYIAKSGSDLEVIFGYLSGRRVKTFEDIKAAIEEMEANIAGAYSIIGTIGSKLFAYRESRGIRPLLMARSMDKVVFSSESTALKGSGFEDYTDVPPGTLVMVDEDLNITMKTLYKKQKRTCFFEWIYFSSIDSVLERKGAYEVRFSLGAEMAKLYKRELGDVDIVVPVPESSRPAAISASEVLDKPYREVLVKNRYIQRTFILQHGNRNDALKKKMIVIREEVKGKNLLVIDDSIVRGNTAKRIIKMLKENGAKKIYLMTICPEIKHPCYYGIDMPDTAELVSARFDRNALAEEFGVEKVFFPEVDLVKQVVESADLCLACVNGEYPTETRWVNDFVERRKKERAGVSA